MPESSYRIRIVSGDMEFEAEGNRKFVFEMMERFGVENLKLSEVAVSRGVSDPTTRDKSISVAEFIRSFDFRKHTDLVMAFAYYLESYAGIREFAAADINNLYYEAKRENSNTSQMIINNIRRGYMMEAKKQKSKKKKRYTLTKSGEEYVEQALKKQD